MLKWMCAGMVAVGLVACSAKQQLTLTEGGGGRAELEFVLPPYLLEQADALLQNLPPGTPDFFSPEEVQTQLAAHPAIKNPKVESARRGAMKISWEFDDLAQLISGVKKSEEKKLLNQTLKFTQLPGKRTRLELHLTRENYQLLLAANPILADNPIIKYYGPSVTAEVPPDDYHDLISFAFGEQARAALPDAQFQLDITTPRPVAKVEGGDKLAANRVRFVLPLMDLLYFSNTALYAIEY